jgi:hypothetical protein
LYGKQKGENERENKGRKRNACIITSTKVIDKKYLQMLKRVNEIARGNISRAKVKTYIQENDLETT